MLRDDSRYRWYALAMAMATYGAIAGAARLCMPVLFPEIAEDLGLSLVAIGTIWGMDPLAGVFIGLPAGLFIDRFGIRKTLTVVCILTGIFGAVRGFTVDFVSMAAAMFIFGFMSAIIPSVVPKITAVWFTGKQLATANGLLNVAWSFGAVLATISSATVLAPVLGGWRFVLVFFAVPPILLGILWWLTGREPHAAAKDLQQPDVLAVPFRESISHVFKIKDVWILGIILMLYWGANMGYNGYIPTYLRYIGWTETAADTAATFLAGFGMIGVMPIVMLSNRLGRRKIVMAGCAGLLGISMALLPLLGVSGMWGCVIIAGLLRAAPAAIGNAMLFETEGVGGTYAGTAIGLTNSLGMLGAFASPPIGNSLETPFGLDAPIFFWAALSFASIPLLFFFKREKIRKEPVVT